MFQLVRQDDKKSKWIVNNVWNNLIEKWNMHVYGTKCQIGLKNHLSDKGDNLHMGESISVHKHVICMV